MMCRNALDMSLEIYGTDPGKNPCPQKQKLARAGVFVARKGLDEAMKERGKTTRTTNGGAKVKRVPNIP
jgi:hypothetical protein